jgi:serine phosphatase RsbU (regulator of sigma subunit)
LKENIKILIIDENKKDAEKLSDHLISNGYPQPIIATNELEFDAICTKDEGFDVIISEQKIGNLNSLQILNISRQKCGNIIFILVSDDISDEFGLELIKEGIDIYFLKKRLYKLTPVIEKLYDGRHIQEKLHELEILNKKLEDAYTEIELKNKFMIQDISFAQRIQLLTLPKMDLLLKNFDEAFIIYKPKDIVSGDFYWFKSVNGNGKFLAAIGDSTGHGVSGALLAMIGYNLLNEIVGDDDYLTNPTDILFELDNSICKLLKQDEVSTIGYQDGIDMSFVTIDKNNKKIYFSGCRRPLLYLVKKENKIIVYKGDPYLVGGVNERITKTFKTQEIDYESGDIIYMLTDGLTDQFGGEHDKKLMKSGFIKILSEIQHLNLSYQSQLLEQKLLRWQGNNEQTDDILVVGIKLNDYR